MYIRYFVVEMTNHIIIFIDDYTVSILLSELYIYNIYIYIYIYLTYFDLDIGLHMMSRILYYMHVYISLCIFFERNPSALLYI